MTDFELEADGVSDAVTVVVTVKEEETEVIAKGEVIEDDGVSDTDGVPIGTMD